MSHKVNNANTNNSKLEQTHSLGDGKMLYSFPEQGKGNWSVQDDVVMGGRSDSQLEFTDDKHAKFSGTVSLENNGGFCSMRHISDENEPYRIEKGRVAFVLLVKGDGKDYNFRVKTPNVRYSYTYTFSTQDNGKWERISIPFGSMEASFRGRKIAVPNYAAEDIVEMRFLIGNKKNESFEILIESIEVI
jgi:hypothetical protein